ncbi:MAG: vitamin B12 dependent-methionine synthase activation domain-containing protein [Candidatus Marinimicrobia bacterium]|jgi:hypothetical protein|nr:hypothetical protein [Candidatus Neomarinimicrobiota bacterium]MDP6143394.1 vitamin B12 dependent-methionine synthase activation domain-containing protein [Candidatus Neomarinimicrobiota bacterium]MDP6261596.1 vitamin B12 dependent-methionine synthase activation domain-containing protein [Candidatus Neomarinimicrobiota bacterium]MDP7127920.1 vitamin B12 dependent-methionine synthase activation domain-containing protein [Candidatus Neomarinimicrobiota bacterium]MDP7464720.1 vitamin B12 depend|tara:strand:- start:4565 stop:5296 length:732 start_codon:yes stop_codon:yes gene_type:complete
MSKIDSLTIAELMPTPESVLRQMGVPKQRINLDKVYGLTEDAIKVFSDCAEPAGLLSEISKKEFAFIYKGEGNNAKNTPLEHIFTEADNLAVYALTLGNKVSKKIEELCNSDDVALGGILDATASVAADKGAEFCEQYLLDILSNRKLLTHDICVLAYSPGYCGWHVSGQKKLFHRLKPEQIGITLNENCLMNPIKSVSGVLVAGLRAINYFKPKWNFCEICTTYSCLQRMKRLRDSAKNEKS